MKNVWTEINENMALYFKDLLETYDMKAVKVSSLSTALINKRFALIISIDRFEVDVYYVYRANAGQLKILSCGSFFTEKYDSNDRQDLILVSKAGDFIINCLTVIAHGLKSKWNDMLKGDTAWMEKYKSSKWYSEMQLRPEEEKVLSQYI